MRNILLASASPRRRQLLKEAGLIFTISVPGVDERIDRRTPPGRASIAIARRKALAAAEILKLNNKSARALVIAADTVVCARGELLGKADGAPEARRILRKLSGTRHVVATGVCLLMFPEMRTRAFHEKTFVTMRRWTPSELDAYIRSGEWKGKAGAYAIQETADRFVTKIRGSYTNVVGLPMERLISELARIPGISNRRTRRNTTDRGPEAARATRPAKH
ncbi:MAG: septum formation protein Maf [Planctomycetes bacterium]|nr:septum formation protein Maf [Planctomycetota bacterium]